MKPLDLNKQSDRNIYAESNAEKKIRLNKEIGLLTFVATKKLRLIPIGKVRFSFKKRKGSLWVNDVNIYHDSTVTIDEPTFKAVMKAMKVNKTDLLTDGNDFYTRTGESNITRVGHNTFNALLSENDEIKATIHHLRFG